MANPSESSPSPLLRVAAAVGGVLLLAAAIVVSNQAPAAAMGLERFGSCDELRDHLVDAAAAQERQWGSGFDEAIEDAVAGEASPAGEAAGSGQVAVSGDDGTNTQVAGVDEIDIVEVLPDGRSLVARSSSVMLVSADGQEVLDRLTTAPDPRITFDDERSVLWVVSSDWQATTLQRVELQGDAFGPPEGWSVEGRLVDLRRSGATVHLVAVDDEVLPIEPGPASTPIEDAVPFAGTSPVPCDQVLHTSLPGGSATTLVARFSADSALTPTAAAEVVGAGDNVLVTDRAVYLSTPVVDGVEPSTGIHRFDAADLSLTGSGTVNGRLLNQFSLDEHDGHLRVAVTHGSGGFGRPMPVDALVDGDIAVEARSVEATPFTPTAAPAQEDPEPTDPDPIDPTTSTTIEEPTTTTTEDPTTTTTVEPTTTSTTEEETTTTTAAPVPSLPPQPDALNEIVVLDVEGSLDVVGRSTRFGKPHETIHGIRFAGEVAYAVTFLQTDPFYVVDLSDPTQPTVLGELEIPGFSAYLHPISATEVVGFGPGPEGNVLARLFDVSDPMAPTVVDTVVIGEESPIAHDHHALRTSGRRMLMPATEWIEAQPRQDCPPAAAAEAELEGLYLQLEELGFEDGDQDRFDELMDRVDEVSECAWPSSTPRARIVTLTPGSGELRLTSTTTEAGDAQRILPLDDGGFLVVGSDLQRVSADGAIEAELA